MEHDDIPKIFKDMRFYVQAINHSKRVELVLKLTSKGGIEVDQPNHPLCRAIFVFATNVQPYIIRGSGKARPLETCLNEKTWTFHDLCTHFGRKQGDKEKRHGFVADASWVDECIQRGAMVQRQRWSGKEIFTQLTTRVKKKDRTSIPAITTSTQSASPLIPASLMSTPIDSPATRQSTGTPALETDQGRDDTVDQVNKSNATAVTQRNQVAAAHTISIEPPGIFTSYTKRSESFQVFPHRGSAKLVASINYYGGQVVNNIELANYIIVDRASARQIPPLQSTQEIIDAIWIDHSLDIGSAQNISEYVIIPGDIPDPSSVDNKPQVASGASSASIEENGPVPPTQSQSSTTGRKRSATLTSGGPVAKMKGPGTPKAAQVSSTGTSRDPNSVANDQDEATTVAYSLSGLFQIASENDTPAQKASRKYYVDQVVNELNEWCRGDFYGTRTAFLMARRKDVNPEFDRVSFFSYNKKAILRALSQRGRDVGLGSELYEGARRSGKTDAVASNSSVASRPIQSVSSASRALAASTAPKFKPDSVLVAKAIASASVADTSSSRVAAAPAISEALRSFFHPSGEIRRLGPLEAGAKQERQKLLLAYMIDELDQWCHEGSPGSRYAFLAGMNASSPLTFDRNRLFTENKEAILQVLKKRGRQVHKGTKIYGEPLKGPHKFVYNRRDGREIVLSQSTSTSASKPPAASRNTTNESSAQPSQLILSRNDPAPLTTSPTTSAVATTAANLSIPAPRRKRAPTISTPQTIKKESNLAQLIDELQAWCEGKSSESRTAFFQSMTVSKPGFDRAALFKRNRDFILQALKDRNIDVSRGSKAYGNSWVKGRTFTWRWTHDEDEETQSPSARATRPSGSSHAKLTLAQPVFKAAPASSSHSFIPIKTTPAISQIDFDGLGSDPDASPYDVPLPFPVKDWLTSDNE